MAPDWHPDMSPRRGRRPLRAHARAGDRRFVTTVHARGAGSLDGMLAVTEIASGAALLDDVLGGLAEKIALLLGVDVCSIYLRDEEALDGRRGGELVLRATHGLPAEAVGAVRMRVGEGLTGFAVECLRPVSVATVTA